MTQFLDVAIAMVADSHQKRLDPAGGASAKGRRDARSLGAAQRIVAPH